MKHQYSNFQSLQELRKYWIKNGHKNVPEINCCCGFPGMENVLCPVCPATKKIKRVIKKFFKKISGR